MITGCHFLLYSKDPEADRGFFREVLRFPSVDLGHGWLIFGLPESELAVHPTDGAFAQRHAEHEIAGVILYLMCDNLQEYVEILKAKNVLVTEIEEAQWGSKTTVVLPSGSEIGLYQPKHATVLGLK